MVHTIDVGSSLGSLSASLYLRRDQAAEYIRTRWGIPCKPRTLAKRASVGGGPTFRKAGRFPLYTQADLDDWAKAQIGRPQRSTSDASPGISEPSRIHKGPV